MQAGQEEAREGQDSEKRLLRVFKVGHPQGPSTEKWPLG